MFGFFVKRLITIGIITNLAGANTKPPLPITEEGVWLTRKSDYLISPTTPSTNLPSVQMS